MCGRFILDTETERLVKYFHLDELPDELAPRYNIAPGQQVSIIREVKGLGRRLDMVKWGLIPSWAKEPAIGNRLINARAETAEQKPAFRAALRRRRCLVPASGFYEWRDTEQGKQPYLISLEGRQPFAIAALWEHWDAPDGSGTTESCVLLTTDSNELIGVLHDRMPVILSPENYQRWLDPDLHDPVVLQQLLKPLPAEMMQLWPVSRAVNDPHNEDPALIEPLRNS